LPALAAVAVLVGLVLGTLQPVLAQDKSKVPHLQFALYEIREAKLDVKGTQFAADKRTDFFEALDAAADAVKKCIKACGEKPTYDPPTKRPDYPNLLHLRHAITELKQAREELKTLKDVAEDVRSDGLKLIDQAITQLDTALAYVKK
jgi:hypothetical protein